MDQIKNDAPDSHKPYFEENPAERTDTAGRPAVRRKSRRFMVPAALTALAVLLVIVFAGRPAVPSSDRNGISSEVYSNTETPARNGKTGTRSGETVPAAKIDRASPPPAADGEPGYRSDGTAQDTETSDPDQTANKARFGLFRVRAGLEKVFGGQNDTDTESERNIVTHTKKVRIGESLGRVVTSGYCSCPICCGEWSGGPTASGTYPIPNHTIAVDAEDPFVPLGTHVVMNGVEYVVEDTGDFAQYGVQFDIYYDSHSEALKHGHRVWEAFLADGSGDEVQVIITEVIN